MDFPAYRSTRAGHGAVSFRHALMAGLADDGGLFIPEPVPNVADGAWREAPDFATLAANVLTRWLGGEIAPADVARIVRHALDFPVPVVRLEGGEWRDVHVLELFHGPTLSFKDFGARTMAGLVAHFLRDDDPALTILVATSGDTGSAVADGFAGRPGIRVVLLYPHGQVSPTQERQLIVGRPGVTALAVDGSFDDCQRLVKDAFADPALATAGLSSANSINIGRLLPQMTYYFEAVRRTGTTPVFCVPSGNLGDLTGGLLAHLGGLPVRRFIAAHNANDLFPRILAGRADHRPGRAASVRTISNAMDVGVPSNLERIRALLTDDDMRRLIHGSSTDDDATRATQRRVHQETGYVADPHTAVGLEAARRYRAETGDDSTVIVLSTAHPAKFPEVMVESLGFEPERPATLDVLWDRETDVTRIAPTLESLRDILLTDR